MILPVLSVLQSGARPSMCLCVGEENRNTAMHTGFARTFLR